MIRDIHGDLHILPHGITYYVWKDITTCEFEGNIITTNTVFLETNIMGNLESYTVMSDGTGRYEDKHGNVFIIECGWRKEVEDILERQWQDTFSVTRATLKAKLVFGEDLQRRINRKYICTLEKVSIGHEICTTIELNWTLSIHNDTAYYMINGVVDRIAESNTPHKILPTLYKVSLLEAPDPEIIFQKVSEYVPEFEVDVNWWVVCRDLTMSC